MNKVILVGNLTREPDLAETSNGHKVCRFTIAVNRNYNDSQGNKITDFVPCVAWNVLATNIGTYLTKGQKVAIAGSLETREYTTKEGEKRRITEIRVDEAEFLNSKQNNENTANKPHLTPVLDEDLPF